MPWGGDGRTLPRWCYLVGRYRKSADCVFWVVRAGETGGWGANLPVFCTVGHLRTGCGRDACTGLGKFAPLKNATWENGSARCKSAQKSASFAHPPVRPPRPRHRPHSGTAGPASSYRLPTPPGTTRPLAPASHQQTAKRPAHRNGRRGVNTQRAVSARRLTRQLLKSPRPQRRHLRYRLLARPLRERQRPQEQQRG